jgi:hypothetical protein
LRYALAENSRQFRTEQLLGPGFDRDSWNRSMRKLIGFDDDTADKLARLGRDRMATLQELADEAFADLLKKHGVPIDLKDALRKSSRAATKPTTQGRKT